MEVITSKNIRVLNLHRGGGVQLEMLVKDQELFKQPTPHLPRSTNKYQLSVLVNILSLKDKNEISMKKFNWQFPTFLLLPCKKSYKRVIYKQLSPMEQLKNRLEILDLLTPKSLKTIGIIIIILIGSRTAALILIKIFPKPPSSGLIYCGADRKLYQFQVPTERWSGQTGRGDGNKQLRFRGSDGKQQPRREQAERT